MKTFLNTTALCLLLLLNLSCNGQNPNEKIPLDPDLRYGKLPNGFTYYIKNLPSVQTGGAIRLNLMVPGKRFEDRDQLELAHLIEHVIAQNGTSSFPISLNSFIEKIKYNNPDINLPATINTSFFRVEYMWSIPEQDSILLTESLHRLREIAWDEQVLNDLEDSGVVDTIGRRSILDEINRPSLNVDNKSYSENKITYQLLGQPYVDSRAENVRSIRTFKLPAVSRFYRDWYRPDKQALFIVGPVDLDSMEAQVQNLFSELSTSEETPEKPLSKFVAEQRVRLPGKRQVLHVSENRQDLRLELYTMCPTNLIMRFPQATEKAYQEVLEKRLYERLMHNRMEPLRRKPHFSGKYLPYSIYERRVAIKQVDFAQVSVDVDSLSMIGPVYQVLIEELERVARHGFTDKEISEAKEYVLNQVREEQQSPDHLLSLYEGHYLVGAPAPSPDYSIRMTRRLLENISRETMHKLAKSWLSAPDQAIVLTTPENLSNESLPDKADFDRWQGQAGAQDRNITPYRDKEEEVYDLPMHLLPERILREIDDSTVSFREENFPEIDLTVLHLDNGAKLLIKPTETQEKGKVFIRAGKVNPPTVRGKDARFFDVLRDVLKHSRFGARERGLLEAYAKSNGGEFTFGTEQDRTSFEASGDAKELAAMLELMHVSLTGMVADPETVSAWQEGEKQSWREQREPTWRDLVTMDLMGRSAEASSDLNPEEISEAELQDVYDLTFGDARNWTIIVTGDFDSDKVRTLLVKHLGNMPAYTKQGNDQKDVFKKESPIVFSEPKDTVIYGEGSIMVNLNYAGKYQFSNTESIRLKVLNQLLKEIIKNKSRKTGIYRSPGVFLDHNLYYYRINIDAHSLRDEEILPVVRNFVFETVEQMMTTGPESVDLDSAKAIVGQGMRFLEKGNNYQTLWRDEVFYGMLEYETVFDRDYITDMQEQYHLLKDITPEQIRETAQKYLDGDNRYIYTRIPKEAEQ